MKNVLIMTNDKQTATTLSAALSADKGIWAETSCHSIASLKGHLDYQPKQLVLVDADPNPLEILEKLTPLVNGYPQSRFVLLCQSEANSFLGRAMQAGIRHIQQKEAIATELPSVLKNFFDDSIAASKIEEGVAVTVLQAGGGCGATTIAVNLANEFSLKNDKKVLLVDMDQCFGSIATYLDLSGQYGIAEVLQRGIRIDTQLIESTAVRYSDNIQVLLSPASLDMSNAGFLDLDGASSMLSAAKQGFPITVIDAPRIPMKAAAALAFESSMVFVIMQPLVKDIRVAKSMLWSLIEQGVPRENIRPVMNRCTRRQTISIKDAQAALGSFSLETLRNDYAAASKGINFGKPMADTSPRAALRRDLLHLASVVPLKR